jgi:hypothetical protein
LKLTVKATEAANKLDTEPPKPSAVLQARAGLQAALAALAAARVTLTQTELRAPADGIIVSVNRYVGEIPGQSAGTGGSNVNDRSTGGAFITMTVLESRRVLRTLGLAGLDPLCGAREVTPSETRRGRPLPWHSCGNPLQPTATLLAYLGRFRGRSICHRLPPVATARLHKRSILGQPSVAADRSAGFC